MVMIFDSTVCINAVSWEGRSEMWSDRCVNYLDEGILS